MANSSRSFDITVISAEDLRLDRRSIKKNAFVIVQTDSHNRQATDMNTDDRSYLSWNQKLILTFPNSVSFITVEVQCKTSSGERTVGTARIPVSDFTGDYTPACYLHFLSYRLRDRNGERNGVINLSIRMGAPEYVGRCLPALGVEASGKIALGVPVSNGYGYGMY